MKNKYKFTISFLLKSRICQFVCAHACPVHHTDTIWLIHFIIFSQKGMV